MDELIGKQLGLYKIVSQLGTGGMANVYKAYQSSVDRHVAIKVLTRQHTKEYEIFVNRFMQEAQVVAKLEHPHILPVYDFGETENYLYLVMRLVNAGTLWDRFHGQPFPVEHIRHIIIQVGDALDYAHTKGIVHRDVKPKNILMDDRDNCLLTDFGIAKVMQADLSLTQMGTTLGTPTYMSPEQIQGEPLDGRSDIYALGVILFQLATGHLPFEADTPHEISTKHLYAKLPSAQALNPDLPASVEAIIAKAMAKNPDARYVTAGEMVKAMKDLKLEKPVSQVNGFEDDEDDGDQTTVLPSLDSDQFISESLVTSEVAETVQLDGLPSDGSSQPTPVVPDSQPAIQTQVIPDSQPVVAALESAENPINVHDARLATPPPFPVGTDAPSQSFWSNRGVWIFGAIGILIIILLGVLIGLNLSRPELAATSEVPTEQPLDWSVVLEDDFSEHRLDVSSEEEEKNGIERKYDENQYVISVKPVPSEDNTDGLIRNITFIDDRVYEDFLLEVYVTEKSRQSPKQSEETEADSYGVTFRNQGRNFYTLEITGDGLLKLFKVSAEEDINFAVKQVENIEAGQPIHLRLEAIGPVFTVTVNDTEMYEFNDPTADDYLKQGDIGFVVHPVDNHSASAAFDNLKISAPQ
ncbi:MAG: protein kinase [Anaerolineae bacterium]|nr:protein kinase [Anaerolineae bacterium]